MGHSPMFKLPFLRLIMVLNCMEQTITFLFNFIFLYTLAHLYAIFILTLLLLRLLIL